MGHEFRITRAARWKDRSASPITLQEWLRYAAADTTLRLDPEYVGAAMLASRARGPHADDGPWITHDGSGLVAVDPDDATLRKLHRIAATFGARVLDEDDNLCAADETPTDAPQPASHDVAPPREHAADPTRMRSLHARCRLLTVLFAVIATVSAVATWVDWRVIQFVEAAIAGERFDVSVGAALVDLNWWSRHVQTALNIGCAIAFVWWFWRAHKNLVESGVGGLRFTSKWAIGGWFLPFLNLVVPPRVMSEVDRGSSFIAGVNRSTSIRSTPRSTLVGVWWTLFIVSGVLRLVAKWMARDAKDADDALHVVWFQFGSELLNVAAALAALALVRRITQLQEAARLLPRHAPAADTEATANYRETLLGVLRTLADLENQRAYERNVKIADVPAELVCMWFDDLHPSVDDVRIAQAFDPREREILATFHRAYAARLPSLPDRPRGIVELHACPAWHEVVEAAKQAVRAIELHDG